ncbi:hypothetical protein LCGC14_1465250 [marine sediment metagenome]|uniref:Uncharacterized protein n=1 Tax=marine sediment metagenome TaxID=412755 RepID=A0A0F9MFT9_9ZZZZ
MFFKYRVFKFIRYSIWNQGNVWNDGNAYIPFYLLSNYKSGANSFSDGDGTHVGRLKELFLEKFGIGSIDYLTSDYTAK